MTRIHLPRRKIIFSSVINYIPHGVIKLSESQRKIFARDEKKDANRKKNNNPQEPQVIIQNCETTILMIGFVNYINYNFKDQGLCLKSSTQKSKKMLF